MSRIRSVHPGLFSDESFVALSMQARVLLIGIWTECDDKGAFEWKPITLKMRLMPADDVNVAAALAEMEATNIVKRYEIDGKSYGAVRNFRKFQRPQKPNDVHPMPPELRTYVCLADPTTAPVEDQSRISTNHSATGTVKSPQMEDGRGKRKDGGDKDAAKEAAPSIENQFFARGKEVAGREAGGLLVKLLKAKDGNIPLARAAVEVAATKQNPREYLAAIIRNRDPPPGEANRYVDPRL